MTEGTSTAPAEIRHVMMSADAVGGVWTYALDLARCFSHRGIATTAAIFGPAPSHDQLAEAGRIDGLDVVETDLPLDWTADGPSEIARAGEALSRLARQRDVDLLHLNSPALAAELRFGLPVVGICHSCVATWWASVRRTSLPADFAWRADLVGRGYARCDALIAPTAAFAAATAAAYGIAAPRIVHNGRAPAGRVRRDSADSSPFAFTAGRLWDDGKGMAVLDAAAADLRIPMRAAGPLQGPNGAAIVLRHAVELGRLSAAEIAGHLAGRPIFVSAARYEPFGLAVLEAASAGCALVLSDIPSFRELWGEAALFVPADDVRGFSKAIGALAVDPARRGDLGRAARDRATAYSAERMANGTFEIYRAILPSRADGRTASILAMPPSVPQQGAVAR